MELCDTERGREEVHLKAVKKVSKVSVKNGS